MDLNADILSGLDMYHQIIISVPDDLNLLPIS
jgi:hypothetical protein